MSLIISSAVDWKLLITVFTTHYIYSISGSLLDFISYTISVTLHIPSHRADRLSGVRPYQFDVLSHETPLSLSFHSKRGVWRLRRERKF